MTCSDTAKPRLFAVGDLAVLKPLARSAVSPSGQVRALLDPQGGVAQRRRGVPRRRQHHLLARGVRARIDENARAISWVWLVLGDNSPCLVVFLQGSQKETAFLGWGHGSKLC